MSLHMYIASFFMTWLIFCNPCLFAGSGLGHFIFGAFTAMFYAKFERLNKQLYEDEDRDTLVTDDNNDTIMTDGSHHI